MKSHTTERFRKALRQLPSQVQAKARQAFRLWQQDPSHPSLRFKQVHPTQPIYAVRVGIHWRAVGVKADDTVVWYWIGSHSDYDTLLASL